MKRPFVRGTTLLRGLTNHGYKPLTNWDDPPSTRDPLAGVIKWDPFLGLSNFMQHVMGNFRGFALQNA